MREPVRLVSDSGEPELRNREPEFIEVGSRLIVRVEGLPVAYATVVEMSDGETVIEFDRTRAFLPLALHDYWTEVAEGEAQDYWAEGEQGE